MESIDGKEVPNFRSFYPGLSMLGKHFTIRTLTGTKPNRHYTICNVMEPSVYSELNNMLSVSIEKQLNSSILQSGDIDKIKSQLQNEDNSRMMFVIKNYRSRTGLSEKFFSVGETDFEVKGPMGKSLDV